MMLQERLVQIIEVALDLWIKQKLNFIDCSDKCIGRLVSDHAVANNFSDDFSNRIVGIYPPFKEVEFQFV